MTWRGRDRHLLAGLGIAADALALLAHHERTKRRQLDRFATLQAVRDFFENELNERGAFGSRQAKFIGRLV